MAICHYAEVWPKICTGRATTKDHVIPRSWGGRGSSNLVRACRDCNDHKDDRAPSCWCDFCYTAARGWLDTFWAAKMESLEYCSPEWHKWAKRGRQVVRNYARRPIDRADPVEVGSGVSDQHTERPSL